jgi:hypothetical protein
MLIIYCQYCTQTWIPNQKGSVEGWARSRKVVARTSVLIFAICDCYRQNVNLFSNSYAVYSEEKCHSRKGLRRRSVGNTRARKKEEKPNKDHENKSSSWRVKNRKINSCRRCHVNWQLECRCSAVQSRGARQGYRLQLLSKEGVFTACILRLSSYDGRIQYCTIVCGKSRCETIYLVLAEIVVRAISACQRRRIMLGSTPDIPLENHTDSSWRD